jgi:hydroxymethylpyrimidine/phosphomethylpyrimidine kinase
VNRRPRVLLAGGHEPEGRAGLLADAQAVLAHGAHPVQVPTALTAQGTRTFFTQPSSPAMLRASLAAAREQGPLSAAKLGMVPGPAQWRTLSGWLVEARLRWVVVDPVVRTSRGQPLSSLRPRAFLSPPGPGWVLTPNAVEVAWLLGDAAPARTVEDALRAGARLCERGFAAVVVKGGHLRGRALVADVLITPGGATVFEAQRLRRTPGQRGTGCRFASGVAAALAMGATLPAAVASAQAGIQIFLSPPILPGRSQGGPLGAG